MPVKKSFKLFTLVIVLTLILSWDSSPAAQPQGDTTIISVTRKGDSGFQDSTRAQTSSDGRFIVFTTQNNHTDPIEAALQSGVYLYDRVIGYATQISKSPDVSGLRNYQYNPIISGNGRFIFYEIQTYPPVRSNEQNPSHFYIYDQITKSTSPLNLTEKVEDFNFKQPVSDDEGRFISFTTFSLSPKSNGSGKAGIPVVFDRLNQHLINPTLNHLPENIGKPAISGNGRFLVFFTFDSDHGAPKALDITIYNRVLNSSQTFPTSSQFVDNFKESDPPQITHSGKLIAFLSPSSSDSKKLTTINTHSGDKQTLKTEGNPTSFRLSADGSRIAYTSQSYNLIKNLFIMDVETGTSTRIAEDILSLDDISSNGRTIVYSQEINGHSQILSWFQTDQPDNLNILSGQVVDSTGQPLALVNIEHNLGDKSRTDGAGFFWFSGIPSGPTILKATKEGFIFNPQRHFIEVSKDSHRNIFTYAHSGALNEARKDIGMPYSFDRGTSGSFHGFSSGYCTDLILDAYSWGADFYIQFNLEQDFRAYPQHFYRWRDARNAHDMWRYFANSKQLQPHTNPYQPGDIVFFDWSEDGEIDHVALVFEVDQHNRPRKMIAATGIIQSNPSGLAAELPWEEYHELTVRGFARWTGKHQPVIPNMPYEDIFQTALGGQDLFFWLMDKRGNFLSPFHSEIPGGEFNDFDWENNISIRNFEETENNYKLYIFNPGNDPRPYQFIVQFIQGGLVKDRYETKGLLKGGDIKSYGIFLDLSQSESNHITLRHPLKQSAGYFR